MKTLAFILPVLFSLGAFAEPRMPEPCVDLYRATCDGRVLKEKVQIIPALIKKTTDEIALLVQNQLQQSDMKAFRELSAEAFRVTTDKELAEKLALIARLEFFPNSVKVHIFEPESLETLKRTLKFSRIKKSFESLMISKLQRPDFEKNLETNLLPLIQSLVIEKLFEMPIDQSLKTYLAQKVQRSQYKKNFCKNQENKTLEHYLEVGAAFSSKLNVLTVCNGSAVISKSEEELVFTIAHEYAHSFGPCGLQMDPVLGKTISYSRLSRNKADSQYHMAPLLQCLRNENSVAAKFSLMNQSLLPQVPAFCGDDQSDESIADWFAVEVVAKYLKRKGLNPSQALAFLQENSVLLCIRQHHGFFGAGFDTHADSKDRIRRILEPHPGIREALSCSSPAESLYCTGQ